MRIFYFFLIVLLILLNAGCSKNGNNVQEFLLTSENVNIYIDKQKKIVDSEISQAGSLVGYDRLRFDFHCSRPIEVEELREVEKLIN